MTIVVAAALLVLAGSAGCTAAGPAGSSGSDGGEVSPASRATSESAALEAAKQYAVDQDMSKARTLDILTSASGEGFSKEAAEYAVEHVDADWRQNAVTRAKSYLGTGLTPAEIRVQLVAEYGEQFTQEEADYAIAHLIG